MFARTASLGGGTRMLLSLASSSYSFPPANSARTTLLHAGRMIVRGLLLFALSLIICLVFQFLIYCVLFFTSAEATLICCDFFSFVFLNTKHTNTHTRVFCSSKHKTHTHTHTQGWGGIAAGAGGRTSRGGGSGWNPRTNSTRKKQK
jgi:hypothetical protein